MVNGGLKGVLVYPTVIPGRASELGISEIPGLVLRTIPE
jgi:hypothetical protein